MGFININVFHIVLLVSILRHANSTELTFMLDAKDEMCFYEHVKIGEETVVEFQVVEGGNLDVDFTLTSPGGSVLYKDTQKQYDSYTWTTKEEGEYSWCFSNKFSTFTSKLIYFDFLAGDEPSLLPKRVGAGTGVPMTALEVSAGSIHESLNVIADYQKHFRLKEMSGRAFAEDINLRIMWWSAAEFICIISVMVFQVMTVRSFFSDKKNKKIPTST